MADVIRVVIALCYQGPYKFIIVPDCPYCFCQHKHRVEGIKPLSETYTNGAVVPYLEEMPTKISECTDRGRTYALELRPQEEIPIEKKKVCRGVKNNGDACSKKARPGYCVCSFHLKQQAGILERRCAELTET